MSEPEYVVDNGADDGSHVSFVYGKDAEDPAGERAQAQSDLPFHCRHSSPDESFKPHVYYGIRQHH
jgi:hypothetical protein